MSGGLLVDGLLLLVLLAYGLTGLRRGFVEGATSLAGFVLGGLAGIVLLPPLVAALAADGTGGAVLAPGPGRVVVVLVGVLLLAWLGQAVGAVTGRRLRSRLTWRPAEMVDRGLGAVTAVLVVALLTWLVAGALRTSPAPVLSRAVAESRVVRTVDAVVPSQVGGVAAGLRELLESGGFPRVFDGLGPELILPVDPPDATEVTGAAGVAAGGIVKVTGLAACDRGQEGTGFVVAPQRVVTNAHVVAGVSEPSVQVGGVGPRLDADVVLLDPERDLAVLRVPDLQAAPLPIGEDLDRGAAAVVAGFPLDGPYTAEPARVRQVLTARGENIYGSPGVDRRVYSLFARVEPGNSGGPLLDPTGRVVGVVFAKSLDDPRTGYALTLAESAPVLQDAAALTEPVDVGACAKG